MVVVWFNFKLQWQWSIAKRAERTTSQICVFYNKTYWRERLSPALDENLRVNCGWNVVGIVGGPLRWDCPSHPDLSSRIFTLSVRTQIAKIRTTFKLKLMWGRSPWKLESEDLLSTFFQVLIKYIIRRQMLKLLVRLQFISTPHHLTSA